MNRRLRLPLAAVFAGSLAVSGAGQVAGGGQVPSPVKASPAGQETPGDYPVGGKDLLEIRVFELPELNLDRRVSDAGTISLPLLGEFSVAGLTPAQIREKLESMLTAKYVNRANVSVIVREYASKPVSIVGAVRNPGSLNISGRWFLLQAISSAGGLTESAGRRIYVIRRADNGLTDTLEIDTEQLFKSGAPMWNIPIIPGDVVNVEPRKTIRIFCLGELRSPGAIEFSSDDRITLLSVVAKAGGLTDRASNSIRIKRRRPDGKDVEIRLNFRRILSGKDTDPILQPNDVVVVKESFL